MRLAISALLCVAVSAMLGAPAAQAGAGVRDFELRVGGEPVANGRAAAAGTRTIELNPHRSFDLVGFRWTRGDPRIEVRSYGLRGWSPWVGAGYDGDHAPDLDGPAKELSRPYTSDPVWTGPAYRVRLRVHGAVRGLRAHFVSLNPGRLRALAASSGAGGVAPVTPPGPPPAGKSGSAAPPPFVSRSQWGADNSCKPRHLPGYGEVLGAAVHHTVSTNAYTPAQAPGVVLAICRYHRYSNGWNDVGYNALIDRFGTIYEGRAGGMARAVAGAHAQGFNLQTTGVSLIGNHMTTPPSAEALASLRAWLAWKLPLHGVTLNERVSYMSTGGKGTPYGFGKIVFRRAISGHRDFDSTTCPGNVLYGELNALNTILAPSNRLATRISIRTRRGAAGSRSVYVTGRIRGAGRLVSGRKMLVQAFGDAGWSTIATAESDQDGIYRATVALKRRLYLRAAFDGDARYRSGRSVWKYAPKLP